VKKFKPGTAVTVALVLMIVIFAGLTAYSFLKPDSPPAPGGAAGPAVSGGASGRGGGQAAAPGAGAPGGAARQGGGQAAAPGAGGAPGAGDNPGARNAAVVRTTVVAPGAIENSVVINGDVLAAGQVTLYPTVAGKLTELRFRVGDQVGRGQITAMVDPSRPGEVFSQSPVISTISGTVLQAPLHPGDTVSTGSAVFVIGDLSVLEIETFVPERYANAARRGLAAQVSLEALPGETFAASVYEVSPVLDPASRTLRIRLRFDRPDERIRAGMFATVSLVTNSRRDVPVIPRSSVINTYGSWIVFVVDDDNRARRKVISPGLESEMLIEVLEGVEIGDRVVSVGQNFLSDGDPVRVVEG
jgi:multidrug efflux pump subunit AcrA (membrane-fusion protein)